MSIAKAAIKSALARKDTTATELADSMGLDRTTIYKAINGNPRVNQLEDIAKSLGMKLSEMIALAE